MIGYYGTLFQKFIQRDSIIQSVIGSNYLLVIINRIFSFSIKLYNFSYNNNVRNSSNFKIYNDDDTLPLPQYRTSYKVKFTAQSLLIFFNSLSFGNACIALRQSPFSPVVVARFIAPTWQSCNVITGST